MAKMRTFDEYLLKQLKDPAQAMSYLNAALETKSKDAQEIFLMALRDVAKAHGMAQIAGTSKVAREALYRMLSENGNPELATLLKVLKAVGLKIKIEEGKAS